MASNDQKRGVRESKAGEIHELVAEVYLHSLQQMLASGEADAAMLRNITTWLSNNDITVLPEASASVSRLSDLLGQVDLSELVRPSEVY